MGLQQRAGDWQEKILKAIIFFAVLGCLVLGAAAYMISHTLSDITNPTATPPADSKAKQSQSH